MVWSKGSAGRAPACPVPLPRGWWRLLRLLLWFRAGSERQLAMGNSVSRPSCLGEKSPRPEDFLKEPCSATLNKEEDGAGSPEKACLSPRMIENGWNVALEGATKNSPFPKQNNLDLKLRNCCPLQTQQEGAVAPWTPPENLGASWGWKLHSTREVTEVTEVTETVVTEIVEVTEYPSGDKSREALVTRMVKVLADVREAPPQVNRHHARNFTLSSPALFTRGRGLWGSPLAMCWAHPSHLLPDWLAAKIRWLWLLHSWGGHGH